jgi:hypothetical protein
LKRTFEQEYFYPFEKYGLTIAFIAFNTADNTSLPILNLALADVVNNFHAYWNETETQSILNNTPMNSRTLRAHLERTLGSQIYAMLLFFLTWLITVGVVYVAAIALFGSSKIQVGDGVALLPMTMVLTLPNLRQLFPDAPAFGEPPTSNFFCQNTD